MDRRRLAQAMLVVSVVLLVCASAATALADVTYWSNKADMPTARWRASSGVVGGRIIVLGGTTGESYPPSGITSVVQAYDPTANTWQTMTSMVGPRMAAGSASRGDYVYVAGGGGTNAPPALVDTVIRYNGVSGANSVVGHLDTARFRDACAIVGSNLYVIGGAGNGGALDSIEVYDLDTDQVVQTITMPAARDNCAAVAVGSYIYIFGGWDAAGDPTNTCWRLDTSTGQIAVRASMPVARFGYKGALAFSNGLVRVQGMVYDPAANTWSTEQYEPDMSWTSPVAEVVADRAYRIGGNFVDYGGTVSRRTQVAAAKPTVADAFAAVPGTGGTRSVSVGSAGTVSVVFPTATYTGQMLGVSALDSGPSAAPGTVVSKFFEISTTAQLPSAVTITLPYEPGASSPTICHWNGLSWDALPTTVDAGAHTVTAQSSSLSPFVVVDGVLVDLGTGHSNVPASSSWSIALLGVLGTLVFLSGRRLTRVA